MVTSDPERPVPFYSLPAQFVQQGDVFRGPLVAPVITSETRIFRAVDGRHGSVVFSGQSEGKVFSHVEITNLLRQSPQRDPLQTEPFTFTGDGQMEFVVTNAELIEYFVVLSQTCDVCGVDKDPHPLAMVLRAKTIGQICKGMGIVLAGCEGPRTIHEYLIGLTQSEALRDADEISYREVLKAVLEQCLGMGSDAKENCSRIKNLFASRLKKAAYVYYLATDSAFRMPVLYIDFTAAFTVVTSHLHSAMGKRIATLAEPYRTHFAESFANHIKRIALPAPMQPEKGPLG